MSIWLIAYAIYCLIGFAVGLYAISLVSDKLTIQALLMNLFMSTTVWLPILLWLWLVDCRY